MMATADEILRAAATELGTVESPASSNKTRYNRWYFGRDESAPWCATWVSWVFAHQGMPLPASTAKGFAYTPSGAQWFKDQGRWSSTPERGHVVFFDFPGDNVHRISHVGIVEGVRSDGSIVTIEGNTSPGSGGSQRDGGGVYRRIRSSGIVGYGVPAYGPTPQEEDDMTPEQHNKLVHIEERVDHFQEVFNGWEQWFKDIKAAVAAGGGGGSVDLDALAEKVADKLAARLAD